jgi:imidazolonepropionase-like amidohydrolase
MFQHAVKIGVPIAMGTDAGVEPHGLNAREFSLMTKNGFAGSGADGGHGERCRPAWGGRSRPGRWQAGKFADIVAVAGNPLPTCKPPSIRCSS